MACEASRFYEQRFQQLLEGLELLELREAAVGIDSLADEVLLEIFKYLSPYERLIVSEVCRRWYAVICKVWLEINDLDLGSLPPDRRKHVIMKLPNLQSVFAQNRSFGLRQLFRLLRVSSLSFLNCTFAPAVNKSAPGATNEGFAGIFCTNLQRASWNELILHNPAIVDKSSAPDIGPTRWIFDASCLPAALTHLQLSGCSGPLYPDELEQLQNLECLILFDTPDHEKLRQTHHIDEFLNKIATLQKLRELHMGYAAFSDGGRPAWIVSCLPKLEVLFINVACVGGFCNSLEQLKGVLMEPGSLRILVFSGTFSLPYAVAVPARRRFSLAPVSKPLPPLHVFLDAGEAKRICIVQASLDAAVIHPIRPPMSQFLAGSFNTWLFQGVWVAEKIKEAAKHGVELCK